MTGTVHSRRKVLGALGGLGIPVLAGCSDGLNQQTASALGLELQKLDSPLRDQYLQDLNETRPPYDEVAFREALAGNESYTTQFRKPFRTRDGEPSYTKHNGTYYHLDSYVVDTERVSRPVLRLHTVGDVDELSNLPSYVNQSSLPDADDHAVRIAHMAARARGNEGGGPGEIIQRGGYVYRGSKIIDESRLLRDDGPSHVRYRDRIYRVNVTREAFREPIYSPDVDPVAESAQQLERAVQGAIVDTYLERSELSQEQRSILREAQSDTSYEADFPLSDPAAELLRKMNQRAYIDGNVEGDALDTDRYYTLLYDGEYYRYTLRIITTGSDD
jgi:hypothetical protein